MFLNRSSSRKGATKSVKIGELGQFYLNMFFCDLVSGGGEGEVELEALRLYLCRPW